MKNLKISRKLLVAFAIVLSLLVACIVVSIVNLQMIKGEVDTFYNGPYVVKDSANVINANFETMQKSIYRSMANTQESIVNDALQDVDASVATLQAQLPIVKEHFLGDQQIVTNLQNYLNELAEHRNKVVALAQANQNTEAAAYMEENNIPIIDKATVELDKLISTANNKGDALINSLNARQSQAVVTLTILGVLSILLGICFAVYITKGIVGPVNELEAAAKEMAQGKLNASITYQSRDELGSLAESLRQTTKILSEIISDEGYLLGEMAAGNFRIKSNASDQYKGDFEAVLASLKHINDNLSDTLRQINQSAEQVASGSDQVSSGAQALSQGATEQASSVEELAATISEISTQVKNNAENALQASKEAEGVSREMTESNQQMQEMIQAMSKISESSSQIGQIINTIENIAFQTNILALNAAVEAARAGEAGKGFAVVAEEVRSLAAKSAEASKNTSALIEGSIQAVRNGTSIADATAQSLTTAVKGVERVTDIINRISSASNEQANSIAQVTQGVDQISSVVQTNSATAEQSAAASEELSGQAQMLKDLVGKFKVADTEQQEEITVNMPAPAQSYSRSSYSSNAQSKY